MTDRPAALNIRLSKAELAQVHADARAAGYARTAEYVRRVLLHGQAAPWCQPDPHSSRAGGDP